MLLAAAVAAITGTGCTTDSLDDAKSLSAAASADGPIDTGSYPNLNIAPRAAATQLTTEEKEAKLAALRAAQQRQSPGPVGETADARRKRLQLLGDEQDDTLKVIETN